MGVETIHREVNFWGGGGWAEESSEMSTQLQPPVAPEPTRIFGNPQFSSNHTMTGTLSGSQDDGRSQRNLLSRARSPSYFLQGRLYESLAARALQKSICNLDAQQLIGQLPKSIAEAAHGQREVGH
jgi:hypothetical protein